MNAKALTLYDILRDPEKRRAWVIYQLSLQDKTLAGIAEKHGRSRQSLYTAFVKPYPKMEKVIADEVGMLVCDLFPERYTNGIPNRVIGRPKGARNKKAAPSKKGTAKEWFTALELSGKDGLPATESGVIRRAKKEAWTFRPRQGKGGGKEYHISSLPEAAQKSLQMAESHD